MAINLGTLADVGVRVRADLTTWKRDLDKARIEAQTGGKAIGGSLARGLATATVAAGALSVALGALAVRAIKTADAIGKTADKVGVGVEALQEFRFAAERAANVTNQQLDIALQRFSRRVGEAANGQGELTKTLEQYNIAVRNADGSTRQIEDVLGDLANAVAGAESEQEALRISFKAFDSEGAALVNLLRLGADGMAELRDRARELGGVLSEDQVRAAERANDALTDLENAVSGLANSFLVGLAPAIEYVSSIVTDTLIPAVSEFFDKIAADNKKTKFKEIRDEMEMIIGVARDMKAAGMPIKDIMARFYELEKQAKSLADELAGVGSSSTSTGTATIIPGFVTPGAPPVAPKITKTKLGSAADSFTDSLDALRRSGQEATPAAEETEQTFENILVTNEEIARSISDWSTDLISAVASGESLTDVFADLAQSLAEMVLKALVFQAVMAGMQSAGFGGIPSPFAATASAKGNVFSGGAMQRFATGGVVGRPTAFPMANGGVGLMGEAGPEAIMPLKRVGGVLGVQTDGGSGGSTINVDARGADPGTTMAAMNRAADLAQAGVFDQMARRGMNPNASAF